MEGEYSSNLSGQNSTEDALLEYNYVYIAITMPIIVFCLISVTVNLVILGSLLWVRRPISPTLHISISLAVSDLITLAMDGLCLTLNSLLPVGFAVEEEVLSNCTLLFLEALRYGFRFTTLGHLLALTGNHYLGIRKPLRYPIIMTYRNVCFVVTVLWAVPTVSFLIYFSLLDNDGFSSPDCSYFFMMTFKFRAIISSIFFFSILLMSGVYLRIYYLVQRHQAHRNRFRRAGSTYGRTRQGSESNEKAIFTTMLIVGSTVLGWLPASLAFYLVCDDCHYQTYSSEAWMIAVNALSNTLLITKTALNTVIYAARMNEIKAALRRMRLSLKRTCCKAGGEQANGLADLHSRTSTRLHATPL